MDALTFIAILICVVPFYLFIFMTARWIFDKAEKYENVAIKIINNKLDQGRENDAFDAEIMFDEAIRLRDSLQELGLDVKFADDLTPDLIDEEPKYLARIYHRLVHLNTSKSKQHLLEEMILGMSFLTEHFMKSHGYPLPGWNKIVMDKLQGSMRGIVRKAAQSIAYKANPFVDIFLTLVSSAWLHFSFKSAMPPQPSDDEVPLRPKHQSADHTL